MYVASGRNAVDKQHDLKQSEQAAGSLPQPAPKLRISKVSLLTPDRLTRPTCSKWGLRTTCLRVRIRHHIAAGLRTAEFFVCVCVYVSNLFAQIKVLQAWYCKAIHQDVEGVRS